MAKLLWRVVAIALLVAGGGVGVLMPRDTPVTTVVADDTMLLKERHNRQVAARSFRTAAEDQATAKAAADVRAAAGQARTLEKKRKQRKKAADLAKLNGTVPFDGVIPASCDEFKGNRAIGCALMLAKGFGIDQFPCLNNLWDKESGWNHRAENKGSGAYGIPQALPGSKMASVAGDWRTNPATQIKWGLGYIKGRYSTPCGAWSYFQNNGHY